MCMSRIAENGGLNHKPRGSHGSAPMPPGPYPRHQATPHTPHRTERTPVPVVDVAPAGTSAPPHAPLRTESPSDD